MLCDQGWGSGEVGQGVVAVELRAWARVEGRVMKGTAPQAGMRVAMSPLLRADEEAGDTPAGALRTSGLTVMTDREGRFVFPRVVGAHYQLYVPQGEVQAFRMEIDLQAGEMRKVVMGGSGRRVVGKVEATEAAAKLPAATQGELVAPRPTMVHPANWNGLSRGEKRAAAVAFEESAEYQAWANRPSIFPGEVRADGTFEAVDVPAGEYTLVIGTRGPAPGGAAGEMAVARATAQVTVPEKGNEPVDAGMLRLQRVYNPKVGETAPKFDAAAIVGEGRIDLGDYRGKFVLVDFWATWCGPCLTLGAHLEKVAPGLGERLTVMELSLDERIELPREHLKLHPSAFVQGYAGNREKRSGWEVFGVSALPSLWLISPEGKVVMRTTAGDRLEWLGAGGTVESAAMNDAVLDTTLKGLVGMPAAR
jgi:hypothetical protein